MEIRNRHYLDGSANCYNSETQAKGYLSLFEDEDYDSGMGGVENELIRTNLETLLGDYLDGTTYVDLGPGNAEKSKIILSRAKDRTVQYIGVDIQEMFLEIAREKIEELGIEVNNQIGRFEDIIPELKSIRNKFIYLGNTYSNFDSNEMNELLCSGMNKKDRVYLSTGLFQSNISYLLSQYQNSGIVKMTEGILDKLGLCDEQVQPHTAFNFKENQIEVGHLILENTDNYRTGDFLVCLVSKKPTEEEFRKRVETHFRGEYFSNASQIGFLGRILS